MAGRPDTARTAAAPLWAALLVPVLGVAIGACGAVLTTVGRDRLAGGPGTGALIGLVAAAVGCAVVAAWTLAAVPAVLAVLAEHHRRERLAVVCRRCSPALLRRAAATALGLQLLAAPGAVADDAPSPFWEGSAAAHVAPGPPPGTPAPGAAPGTSAPGPAPVSPAPRPDAVPAPATPVEKVPCVPGNGSPAAARTVDGAVTVLRGDTLWSLAAARLGPGASDEQVARAWPAWYELNRHVLVDGPHRLLPGQRLLVPGAGEP